MEVVEDSPPYSHCEKLRIVRKVSICYIGAHMKRILPIVLTALFLFGCAAERPGLIVQSYPLDLAGKVILIRHFEFDPETATGVRKEAVRHFGESIALDLQRFLKGAGFRQTLVVAPGEAAQGEILIRGTILRVNGGDAVQRRSLELFGFGATEVKATGELLDLASSSSVLGFSFTKNSHYTLLDNESAVRENLREIAREIAAAVTSAAGIRQNR